MGWPLLLAVFALVGTAAPRPDVVTVSDQMQLSLPGRISIGKHQAVAHGVARMKARLETSKLLCCRAAWSIDQGHRQSHADAALAKWQLADAAVESALDSLRLTGGAAIPSESAQVEPLVETVGGTIHSGTGDVLANIVAGCLRPVTARMPWAESRVASGCREDGMSQDACHPRP